MLVCPRLSELGKDKHLGEPIPGFAIGKCADCQADISVNPEHIAQPVEVCIACSLKRLGIYIKPNTAKEREDGNAGNG